MSLKAARPVEFPITEWETFEGETFGYNENGDLLINITAAVRESSWERASNLRTWTVTDADNENHVSGEAEGLRAAKIAAIRVLTNAA